MDAHLYGAVDAPEAALPIRRPYVRRRAVAAGAFVALWSLSLMALSQSTTVMSMKAQAQCTDTGGFIAEFCNEAQSPVLGGADVVAYRSLQQGARAVQGKPDIVAEWNSFRFWFSSTKNRDLFMQAPETYAPLLGGFCPFALTGSDAKMPQRSLSVKDLKAMGTDPDQWLINDDRLLVFRGPEALRLFGRDFAANMEKASQNWEALIAQPKCSGELYNTQCFRTDKGVPAVGGVDVVAFFSLAEGSKPVEGSSKYPFQLTTSDDRGHAYSSTFHFASALSRATFAANPAKYLPAYGGFCSYGMAFERGPDHEAWGGTVGMDVAAPEEGWPWAADVMGPPTSVENWVIMNEKLYFAFLPEVLAEFLNDFETNRQRADERWAAWYGAGDLTGPVSVDCTSQNYGPPVARTCTLQPQRINDASPAKTIEAGCLQALDGACGAVQGANAVGVFGDCSSCLSAHFSTLRGACPATSTALHASVDKAYCW